MPRPTCCRRVAQAPLILCFAPQVANPNVIGDMFISLDELEAIRLADLDNLYQEHAADEMGVSRQTFGRILKSAHNKVADALVNGKTLCVEGGHVMVTKQRTFKCSDCENSWDLPCGTGRPEKCPECESTSFNRIHEDGTIGCHGGEHHQHEEGHCCCKDGAKSDLIASIPLTVE